MKIYTKKGDLGTTGLIGGKRVSKADPRIEAYGTVDELNSYIGLLREFISEEQYSSQLLKIQNLLFVIGSNLACQDEGTKMDLPTISDKDIEMMEAWIDEMDKQLPALTHFILPGGHQANAHCHIARCVCRRAERRSVELQDTRAAHALTIKYLNRLSDYLFVLSRRISQVLKIEEIRWIPEKKSK